MMEPDPANRPSVDEILLHPRIQIIMETQGGVEQTQSIKRNLHLDALYSPIVEKLRNPLSTRNQKTEMILISPRILNSAQKQLQWQNNNKNNKKRKFSERQSTPDSFEREKVNLNEGDGEDRTYFSYTNIELDHKQDIGNLRTIGRSGSFMEDHEDTLKLN
jgi:hypothetical protein